MKMRWILATSILLIAMPLNTLAASQTGGGEITFTEGPQAIHDPESPETIVIPEDGMLENTGPLRLDYVPTLQFRVQQILAIDETYSPQAVNFIGDTSARAQFVQVTDVRGTGSGWTLSVCQEEQFKTSDGETLDGAELSFGASWPNSTVTDRSQEPTIFQDVIRMTVGETQTIATASPTQGAGTWSISFGNSTNNLAPIMDADGAPVVHETLGKPLYQNSAIQLSVPGRAEKVAGKTYQTELTWILSELP
ncbi:WxL domain-containing protein [Enterococcus sp. HY326]|uniref:WxL domain-containing protein n=1 Tax=Enterococcus sp. HY326 TaxID=2971265 RepID=UPI002240103A|nr:WxL domain-containing protein [Enterococcus sp. HY326]